MAKFVDKNLVLKDNQKVIFGTDLDAVMSFDGIQLGINVTLSGISPSQPYHLTTKQYIDDSIATATGTLTTDHGGLVGLTDDDHPQYILVNGSRAFTGEIIGVDPTTVSGLATKGYVDGGDSSTLSSANSYADGVASTAESNANFYTDSEISTLSGTLQNILNAKDEFIELIDTPNNYPSNRAGYMVRVNDAYDGLDFESTIVTDASGNTTIFGDLSISGTLFTVDHQTVQVSDNIIVVNYGETGTGVTNVFGGIEVDRGTSENYFFVFNENTDWFEVGTSGTLQPVATRTSITNTYIPFGNAFDQYTESSDLTFNSGTKILDINGSIVLSIGATIGEFSIDTTLSGNSDSAVPTEKAVKTYIDARDSATLSSANSYADSGDSSTLSSANSYADGVASTAESNANTYTDIAVSTLSGTIITDHGALLGLSDDDHTQYILATGSRAFIGEVTGVYPTTSGSLATKNYVDDTVGAITSIYEHGRQSIADGASTVSIVFGAALPDTNYTINCTMENTSDSPPSIYAHIVYAKAITGFSVAFIGEMDSANYILNWSVIS